MHHAKKLHIHVDTHANIQKEISLSLTYSFNGLQKCHKLFIRSVKINIGWWWQKSLYPLEINKHMWQLKSQLSEIYQQWPYHQIIDPHLIIDKTEINSETLVKINEFYGGDIHSCMTNNGMIYGMRAT